MGLPLEIREMIWVYAAIEEFSWIDEFICQHNDEWDKSLPRGRQLGCLQEFCKEWKEVSPVFMPQTFDRSNIPRKILSRPLDEMDLLGAIEDDPLPSVYHINHKIFQGAFIANLRVLPLHVGRSDYWAKTHFKVSNIRKTFYWRKLSGPIWNTLVRYDLFSFVRTINIEAFELCKQWAFDIPTGDWRRELPFAFVHCIPPRYQYLEGCYWGKVIESDQNWRQEHRLHWRQEDTIDYSGEDWEPYNITAIVFVKHVLILRTSV